MKIKDIGRVVTGKTPPTDHPEYYGDGYKFISPTDLHCNSEIEDSIKHITDAGINSIRGSIIDGFSISVGCIGWDMGNVAYVYGKCATNQQINSITDIREDVNPLYVYYWLKGKKDFLYSIANVTRTPILNKSDFENINIPLPNKDVQDRIGNVLGSIDAVISNDLQICTYFEYIAKMIFDYWFVQFEFPNLDGDSYKSSGGNMVWNDELKRNIPDGWKVKRLKEICSIVLGGTPKTECQEYWNGDIHWLNSGEVAQFPVVTTEMMITKSGLNNSSTVLMPKGTVVVSITGNLRASILAIDSCGNQSIVGVLETGMYKKEYIYQVIQNMLRHYDLIATGNCQQHISKGVIEDTYVICPPDSILEQYYDKTHDLYMNIIENGIKGHLLLSVRDFILPMLMNGQIKFL